MKTTSAQPQLKGFDADVTIGSKNDNYSSQPVMSTTSVESHLKDSNADVNQSDGHEDLWSALRGLTDARKRLRGKDPTPIVEEVTNVGRKKTRLGWGKGLAKYEKEQKEKELLNAAAIEISGVLSNSSTKATEIVTCPDSVPAFSCGSTSPSYGAMPVIGDHGSHNLSSGIGATGNPRGKTSSMTEKVICPASGCYPPQVAGVCCDLNNCTPNKVVSQDAQVVGVGGDPGNSSTSRTRTFAHKEALPSSQKQNALQGPGRGILSTSTRTTELMVTCSNDMPSFTSANSPPQDAGENSDLDDRSMCTNETVVSPGTAPSSKGCSLLSGSKFSSLTMVQDTRDKLPTEGSDKTKSISALTQGIELGAEIIAPTQQETCSHNTTSNKSFRLIIPKLEEPISRTLNGNRSADDKRKKDGSFVAMAQCIPQKPISQGSDKIEGSSVGTQIIKLDGKIIAPPHQGPSYEITTSDANLNLTVSKVDGRDLINFNENRPDIETGEGEQEQKHKTQHNSDCKESTNCIIYCSVLDGDASQADTNVYCGDVKNHPVRGISEHDSLRKKSCVRSSGDKLGKTTTDGEQNKTDKKNPELGATSDESNDCKVQFNNSIVVTDGAELGGDGLVQQQNDKVAVEMDIYEDDNNKRRDERNPQHVIGPNKISGTIMNHIIEPDVENSDTTLIPEGNEITEPQQLISNESSRISQLSSHSDPFALQAVNAKSSYVKFEIDLNIAHEDVASVDVYPSRVGASTVVNAYHLTTHIDLNIPDPAAMNDASDDGGPTNFNLGANVEMAHDLTDVQKYLLPQINTPEITKDPANQPRCFMLFGKVIFQAQANQNHGGSHNMTSNTSVPLMEAYGQSHSSGPWDTQSGVTTDSYQHQSGFLNQMPYGSVNGSEAWPFQSARNTHLHWRQVPHSVNMTPQNMTRAGLAYHMGSGGKSSSLHNFDPHLPDTSHPPAPGPVTEPKTNREGASTSNTCFRDGKENIG